MADAASSALLGVIVGATISAVSGVGITFLNAWVQSRQDDKKERKEKEKRLRAAYKEILSAVNLCSAYHDAMWDHVTGENMVLMSRPELKDVTDAWSALDGVLTELSFDPGAQEVLAALRPVRVAFDEVVAYYPTSHGDLADEATKKLITAIHTLRTRIQEHLAMLERTRGA